MAVSDRHGLHIGAAGGGAATTDRSPASAVAPACGQPEDHRARATAPTPCDDPRRSRGSERDQRGWRSAPHYPRSPAWDLGGTVTASDRYALAAAARRRTTNGQHQTRHRHGQRRRLGRVYGVARVCDGFGVARSSFYAWRRQQERTGPTPSPSRRGPKPAISDSAVLNAIRADLARSPWIGEGHRKVWARLRVLDGLRVARKRVLRLMRE